MSRMGGGHTPAVAEAKAKAKRKVGAKYEEVNEGRIKDKRQS